MTTEETRPPESPNPWPASDQPGSPVPAPQTSEELQAEQNATQASQREQEAQGGAQRPTGDEVMGPGGMSLGRHGDGTFRNEIAGGGKIHEHTRDPEPDTAVDALYFHRRYIASKLAKEAGVLIARSPENIGFWGKGQTYRGNGGILIDVDTMEKHRFPDGYEFRGDEVYANSRDLPPSLVTGELAKNLSGESAQKMAEQRK